MSEPRITVRWDEDVSSAYRQMLERRYELRNPSLLEDTTWRYQLGDRSRDNIRTLIQDPAVDDTGYIDRDDLRAPDRGIRVTIHEVPYPFSDHLSRPSDLLALNSSAWLLLAGGILCWAARASNERRRRNATVATLLLVGALGAALPISRFLVHMGDANQVVETRGQFERYAAVDAVRFEAHLSYAILEAGCIGWRATRTTPERAQAMLARGATAWFVLCALAIGFLERWSPLVLRYLGLSLLAPVALLYFGWREIGYLSLNVAAFPLLARGCATAAGASKAAAP